MPFPSAPEATSGLPFRNPTIKETLRGTFANLSEDEQQLILDMIKAGHKVSKDEIALLKKEKEEEQQKNEMVREKLEAAKKELEKVKEEQLRRKERIVSGFQNDEAILLAEERLKELREQEVYIKQLEKNIEDLKKQQTVKRDLEPDEVSVLKKSISLEKSLKVCTKEMSQLYSNAYSFIAEYNSLSKQQQSDLSVIGKEELLKELQELERLIGLINKKVTE